MTEPLPLTTNELKAVAYFAIGVEYWLRQPTQMQTAQGPEGLTPKSPRIA